jgi:hypothetical protein
MREIVFFISFCFFLLGYGQGFSVSMKDLHSAETKSFVLQENNHEYFKNLEKKVAVVTDCTDLELEEDYHNNDECGFTNQKILLPKSKVLDNWYLDFSYTSFLNRNTINFKKSLCLVSSPIYIKNRVLRI